MISRERLLKLFSKAQKLRQRKESRYSQCMKYAMPGRDSIFDDNLDDDSDDVFDETAIVGTQEFASRLQNGITPNFSRWSRLSPGSDIEPTEREKVQGDLDKVTEYVFEQLAYSNFATESYESYLDLSISLGVMELEMGTVTNPLMFNAIPLSQVWILNGPFDRVDYFFRRRKYDFESMDVKYPDHTFPADKIEEFKESEKDYTFIEITYRDWSNRTARFTTPRSCARKSSMRSWSSAVTKEPAPVRSSAFAGARRPVRLGAVAP